MLPGADGALTIAIELAHVTYMALISIRAHFKLLFLMRSVCAGLRIGYATPLGMGLCDGVRL